MELHSTFDPNNQDGEGRREGEGKEGEKGGREGGREAGREGGREGKKGYGMVTDRFPSRLWTASSGRSPHTIKIFKILKFSKNLPAPRSDLLGLRRDHLRCATAGSAGIHRHPSLGGGSFLALVLAHLCGRLCVRVGGGGRKEGRKGGRKGGTEGRRDGGTEGGTEGRREGRRERGSSWLEHGKDDNGAYCMH
jgi:hypothetical protein